MNSITQLPAQAGDAVVPAPPGSPQRPAAFAVPEIRRPKAVDEAYAPHERIQDQFDDAMEQVALRRQALKVAIATDVQADADLVAAGESPRPTKSRDEPKAELALAEAERERIVLTKAGVTTSRRLHAAVLETREGWLAELDGAEAEAEAEFAEALALAQAAAASLASVRGARAWLEAANERELANFTSHGRLTTRVGASGIITGEEHSVAEVLANLRSVIA